MAAMEPAETRAVFKQALRRVAATVAVVTAGPDDARAGATATSVTAVSMDPPSLLVCINRGRSLWPVLAEAERFWITYLSLEDEPVARAFGGGRAQAERFAPYAGRKPGGLARFQCRVQRLIEHGSHAILIGDVEEATLGAGEPLLYCDGGFRRLAG